MKIISTKNKLIKIIRRDKNLGFVPTMGSIHSGHISLIKKSIKLCDKTIVSIFVNKPQFNRKSDFKKYPRVIKKDIYKIKKLKADLLYLPTEKQIYPKGINKNIKINPFGKKLCGKYRPGHFEAVVDVIDRFIKIIRPKKVFFGEKDMQQLIIINDFIKKNHSETKVIPCKTIREKNGVAFSSRNYLLSSKERIIASKIFKLLTNKKQDLIKNKFSLKKLKEIIYNIGVRKIDYIKVLDVNKLIIPFKKKRKYKIFIAYYLGTTRLIDNI
jgi:pantoate--beta-alanine ligase